MRILFIGDIVGSPGRQIVQDRLADLVAQRHIDPRIAEELLQTDVAVLTGGTHSWDKKEILDYLPHEPRLLRPANFPDGSPGSGLYMGTAKNGVKYCVINLQGRVFLPAIDDPFRKADELLAALPPDVALVFVDMHGED